MTHISFLWLKFILNVLYIYNSNFVNNKKWHLFIRLYSKINKILINFENIIINIVKKSCGLLVAEPNKNYILMNI